MIYIYVLVLLILTNDTYYVNDLAYYMHAIKHACANTPSTPQKRARTHTQLYSHAYTHNKIKSLTSV